jgi:uncharacterized membrane protein YdjX (TVP38/TMEM64 family)
MRSSGRFDGIYRVSVRGKSMWIIGTSAAGVVLLFLGWFLLPISEWLQGFSEWARSLGAAGLALISVAYVLGTLLLVPGFPMTLAVAVVYH